MLVLGVIGHVSAENGADPTDLARRLHVAAICGGRSENALERRTDRLAQRRVQRRLCHGTLEHGIAANLSTHHVTHTRHTHSPVELVHQLAVHDVRGEVHQVWVRREALPCNLAHARLEAFLQSASAPASTTAPRIHSAETRPAARVAAGQTRPTF